MIEGFLLNKKEIKKINFEELRKTDKKKIKAIWINVKNPSEEEIQFLKEDFEVHPVTLEDMMSQQTTQKYEEFEENTVIIFKGIKTTGNTHISTYNGTIIIGEHYVISVCNETNDILDELSKNPRKVENLLKKGKGHIAHYILDKEVDRILIEKTILGEDMKKLEREFMKKQNKDALEKLFSKELLFLEIRQLSETTTDVCLDLTKPTDNYIENDLIPYFRDVYDHSFRTTEGLKTMLGRMNGMRNIYMSVTSIKTNESMRALTIIMALMMPLTIITGFYGMNVQLPMQDNAYAYVMIIFEMIIASIIMIIISKKKGWISKKGED
jgi:magnesium transporter